MQRHNALRSVFFLEASARLTTPPPPEMCACSCLRASFFSFFFLQANVNGDEEGGDGAQSKDGGSQRKNQGVRIIF